jgi:hypothetical protein
MKSQIADNYLFVWFICIGLILGNFLFSCLVFVPADLSVFVVGFVFLFLFVLDLLEELALVLLDLPEELLLLFLLALEPAVLLFVVPTLLLLVVFLVLILELADLETDVLGLLVVDLEAVFDFELELFTFDLVLDEPAEDFVFEVLVADILLLGFVYESDVS